MRFSASIKHLVTSSMVVTLALAVVACGKSDKSDSRGADKASKAKSAAPAKAVAPKAAGDSTDEARLTRLASFGDAMCKCADKACAEQLNGKLRTWLKGVGGYRMSPATVAKSGALFKKYQQCQTKLTGTPFKGPMRTKKAAGTKAKPAPAAQLPPKYADKVRAYMAATVALVNKHKGDCAGMTNAMVQSLTIHSATLTMMREQRANAAVKKWTTAQKDLNEQGETLGRALNECATHPGMRNLLNRLAGKKR